MNAYAGPTNQEFQFAISVLLRMLVQCKYKTMQKKHSTYLSLCSDVFTLAEELSCVGIIDIEIDSDVWELPSGVGFKVTHYEGESYNKQEFKLHIN